MTGNDREWGGYTPPWKTLDSALVAEAIVERDILQCESCATDRDHGKEHGHNLFSDEIKETYDVEFSRSKIKRCRGVVNLTSALIYAVFTLSLSPLMLIFGYAAVVNPIRTVNLLTDQWLSFGLVFIIAKCSAGAKTHD